MLVPKGRDRRLYHRFPRFETGENWFTVTLYNMNYVEADTVGTQVGTPSCNIMPGISTSFFDALAC